MSYISALNSDVRPRPQRAPTQLCLCAAGRPDLCAVPRALLGQSWNTENRFRDFCIKKEYKDDFFALCWLNSSQLLLAFMCNYCLSTTNYEPATRSLNGKVAKQLHCGRGFSRLLSIHLRATNHADVALTCFDLDGGHLGLQYAYMP